MANSARLVGLEHVTIIINTVKTWRVDVYHHTFLNARYISVGIQLGA
jgi:hypothetical protein